MIDTIEQIINTIEISWTQIKEECKLVWGSEQHYQSMIYHCLRQYGKIPLNQLGMNVKMWIDNPKSALFQELDKRKHENFQGGFEPIPDIAIFKLQVNNDWRRRNYKNTLRNLIYAIEIKASERQDNRLNYSEIEHDIKKLSALRYECKLKKNKIGVAMIIVDTADKLTERMTQITLSKIRDYAKNENVSLFYFSQDEQTEIFDINS